ncbi:WhiB family transcriptional regulator [Kitasatospora sp. NPDC058046]|uniref:WhiB family transcriptional regulator n=1 Tax=Kitasatospora sp. NPDC058046 TaxID=3346312 RepID=UPI0036D864D0
MSFRNKYAPNNLPRPPHWRDFAVCRDEKPDLFYSDQPTDIEAAKSVCRGCPVQAECLAGALDRREPAGVWGAMSHEERQVVLAPVLAAEKAEKLRARAEAEQARREAREQQAVQAALDTARLLDVRPALGTEGAAGVLAATCAA